MLSGRVTEAFGAKKLLEVNGLGYSSTEITNLNDDFFGEEPAFPERRELGQIGILI